MNVAIKGYCKKQPNKTPEFTKSEFRQFFLLFICIFNVEKMYLRPNIGTFDVFLDTLPLNNIIIKVINNVK